MYYKIYNIVEVKSTMMMAQTVRCGRKDIT